MCKDSVLYRQNPQSSIWPRPLMQQKSYTTGHINSLPQRKLFNGKNGILQTFTRSANVLFRCHHFENNLWVKVLMSLKTVSFLWQYIYTYPRYNFAPDVHSYMKSRNSCYLLSFQQRIHRKFESNFRVKNSQHLPRKQFITSFNSE